MVLCLAVKRFVNAIFRNGEPPRKQGVPGLRARFSEVFLRCFGSFGFSHNREFLRIARFA